jgi:hypothetical protein
LRSWAILDTFDALSPKYDFPQTSNEISRWFTMDGLPAKVEFGANGIVGNATKPISASVANTNL